MLHGSLRSIGILGPMNRLSRTPISHLFMVDSVEAWFIFSMVAGVLI